MHRCPTPSILEGVAKLISRVTGPRVQKCRASAKFLGHTLSGTGCSPPPNGGGCEAPDGGGFVGHLGGAARTYGGLAECEILLPTVGGAAM